MQTVLPLNVLLGAVLPRSKAITAAGRQSVPLALETFAQLENELSKRIGAKTVAQLRDALEADWGDSPIH